MGCKSLVLSKNKKGINAERELGADAFYNWCSTPYYKFVLTSHSPFSDLTLMIWMPLTFCKGIETRWKSG